MMVGQATAFAPNYNKAVLASARVFKLLDRRPLIDGLEVEVFFKVYLHNPTDCVVRQKEDPICENCVVRHFQMSYDKIFTYICEVV
jgi:hypothetical protein